MFNRWATWLYIPAEFGIVVWSTWAAWLYEATTRPRPTWVSGVDETVPIIFIGDMSSTEPKDSTKVYAHLLGSGREKTKWKQKDEANRMAERWLGSPEMMGCYQPHRTALRRSQTTNTQCSLALSYSSVTSVGPVGRAVFAWRSRVVTNGQAFQARGNQLSSQFSCSLFGVVWGSGSSSCLVYCLVRVCFVAVFDLSRQSNGIFGCYHGDIPDTTEVHYIILD